MKEVIYDNSISSFLYDYTGNDVIIIPRGAESPFEHINLLYQILDNINAKQDLNVYFDFCLLNGSFEQRFLKIVYSNNKFSLYSRQVISENSIPSEIKALCNNYYKANSKKIIDKSFLTDIEKVSLLQNVVFA